MDDPLQHHACLHVTARLETEIFGEVVSDSVRAHFTECRWLHVPTTAEIEPGVGIPYANLEQQLRRRQALSQLPDPGRPEWR